MLRVELARGEVSKPVLIFLPGTMCPSEVFENAAAITGYPAWGLPWLEGAGPHNLPAVAERVVALAGEFAPCVLVGHSTGSAIAAIAAARDHASERRSIIGLVLSNSGANTRGLNDIASVVRRVNDEWNTRFWRDFVRRCVPREISADDLNRLAAYPSRLSQRAVTEALQSQQGIDLTSQLSNLEIPCAVVHGSVDRARTEDHARHMARIIPDCEMTVLDTGHISCFEAPSAFADVVKKLVARTDLHGPI